MATEPSNQPTLQRSKKHSKLNKQETVQGLNQLYTPPDFETDPKCVDIIAVPGLGSDLTRTWMWQGKVHWLRDDTMLRSVIPKSRISVYGYRSQWFGPDAVEIRLSAIARDLLEAIKVTRRESKNKKRPIIFVGHSLGGLVVTKAVTTAKREAEDFKGIIDCITGCVFLGTPFRGSEAQPWAKLIGLAGSVLGQAKYSSLIRTLKSGSTELDDLADDFLHDVAKTQIDVECYCELEKTNGMVIADMKSSTFEGKPRHAWSRTHSEMNKFEGPKDNDYRQLSGVLKDMANQSFKKIKLREDALRQEILNDSRADKVLETLEVNNPKKDLDTVRRINGISKGKGTTPSSWIQKDEKYLVWKQGSSSQNFWVCGGPGKGKTMAAIAIVDELSKLAEQDTGSAVLGHFFCDERDKDKSKAINVLKSLSWQLLRAKKHLVRHFFGEDNTSRTSQKGENPSASTDVEDEFDSLPALWKCLKAALNDPSAGTVYFVVNNLDQIQSDSRKQLLDFISSFQPVVPDDESDANGPFVKWLFLSVHRDDIQESLQKAKILNLDDGSNSVRQDDDLRAYVRQKVSAISSSYSRALEYFIKSYICMKARGKSNYDWVNLVCLELDNGELQETAVRQRLESLPIDLYPMYDQVSHRVLGGSDIQVEYSKEILRCLLLVHYPPTLQELAVVAGLPEEDRENRKALRTYVQRCGALTTMFKDGQDIKVQLSHTSVRDFLKAKYNEWLSMGSEQIQHGVIALRCFEFVLSTVKAVETSEDNEHENDGDVEDQEHATIASEQDARESYEPGQTDYNEEEDAVKTSEAGHIDNSDDDFSDFDSGEEWEEGSEPDTNQQINEKSVFKYPVTQWIEHALEATADIVENLGIEDVFWVLGSKERAEWSRHYSQHNPDLDSAGLGFDADFTALHVAAYFGYVPLADLLMKSDQHAEEIHTTDSSGFQPLFWACRRGHMSMVQNLCEAGSDINFQKIPEEYPLTALHGAVISGSTEITTYLLNHHAEINAVSGDHGTPLYIAAENGDYAIVEQLLSKNADPNLQGGVEVTALNAAVWSGSLEIVKLLVDNGAFLNPKIQYYGGNALGAACAYGNREIAEFLLQKGCSVTERDSEGSSPLEIAAAGGHAEIVELLLHYDTDPGSCEKALIKAAENDETGVVFVLLREYPTIRRSDAFYSAACRGYTEVVKALTSAGVETHILEKSLYEAVDYQYEETVRVLLDMGISPNAEGAEYGNALQASAYDGTTQILEMLLEKGANPDRVYPQSEFGTALQAACYEGTLQNVQILIAHGANVNPQISGTYGTPLQAACAQGNTQIVQLLLEHRADPNTEGGMHGYALIAATDAGQEEIVELLVNHGAKVNINGPDGSTPLTNAGMELPKSSLEFLIGHGAYIHARDGDGDTALTNAAAAGDEDSVRYLLEQGLDVQAIGKWGGALYRATENRSSACMNVLLEYNIDVNQEGGSLHTPLQVAASLGDVELVDLLLEYGANPSVVGGKYHNALQAAVAINNLEIVQRLLEHGVDVNENGGEYGTPLHAAMYAEDPIPFIDLLLYYEADINAVHERGTPLQLAAAVSISEIVLHLLDKNADPNIVIGKYGTALQAACLLTEYETVDVLIERGSDPFLRGGFYGNAFVAAAANNMVKYVQDWLARDPPSDYLVEALHFAVHFRAKDAVKVLLDHGVNVNVKSSRFDSAMMALEAEVTPTERNIMDGDLDFWYPEEDDEEEEEDDDNDDIDNDGDEDEDEDEDEDDADADAEVIEEIRKMLQELLGNAHEGVEDEEREEDEKEEEDDEVKEEGDEREDDEKEEEDEVKEEEDEKEEDDEEEEDDEKGEEARADQYAYAINDIQDPRTGQRDFTVPQITRKPVSVKVEPFEELQDGPRQSASYWQGETQGYYPPSSLVPGRYRPYRPSDSNDDSHYAQYGGYVSRDSPSIDSTSTGSFNTDETGTNSKQGFRKRWTKFLN